MSNTNQSGGLQATLVRLSKLTAQNQSTSGVKYWKAKPGKNNLLVLPTPETGDPFLVWGEHRSLTEPTWKSIPCTKHNHNDECIVCQIIDDLKAQNWKGNFNIWKPIELKIRYYSAVVDLDDLEAGLQWWGYGKSVLGQFENWLLNLEEDEKPFYDLSAPEKVIVNYVAEADPSLKYKLDKKPLKQLPEGVAELAETIKPLSEIFKFDKKKEEVAEMLEVYMTKIQESLESDENSTTDDDDQSNSTTQSDSVPETEAAKPEIKKLNLGKKK